VPDMTYDLWIGVFLKKLAAQPQLR
jgi:hypothetical protein